MSPALRSRIVVTAALVLGALLLLRSRAGAGDGEAVATSAATPTSRSGVDGGVRGQGTDGAAQRELPPEHLPALCELRLRFRSEHEIPSGVLIDLFVDGRPVPNVGLVHGDEAVIEPLACTPMTAVATAGRAGLDPVPFAVTPTRPPAAWTEIELPEPCSAELRVVDEDREPIEGAAWVAHPFNEPRAVSDGSGRLTAGACGGTFGAGTVVAPGYRRLPLGGLPTAGVTELTLQRTDVFAVRTDCAHEPGEPIVAVWGTGGPRRCTPDGDAWICEDSGERPLSVHAEFEGRLWTESGGRVSLDGPGTATVRCGVQPPHPARDAPPTRPVRLRVLGVDGEPAPGADLSPVFHKGRATTDGRGVATLEVPEFDTLVLAGAPNRRLGRVVVPANADEATVRLQRRNPCDSLLLRGEPPAVFAVSPASPHWAAGLRPHDRLVAIDGTPVTDLGPAPTNLLANPDAGSTAAITYARPGIPGTQHATVTCPD